MPVKHEIKIVTEDFINELLEKSSEEKGYLPLGRFLTGDDAEGRYISVDNSTGNAWTETFTARDVAERWLRGEIEVEGWNRRTKREQLKRQEKFRREILDEVIEALAFDGKIDNWKDAAAIVENLKNKGSSGLRKIWHA